MENRTSLTIATDLFCGAGIGLLLGVLVGLSVTSVVAEVVVGIVALLAAALGLVSSNEKISVRPWRIGAFGLCATLSVLVALFVRTQDLLAPSAAAQHRQWLELGFSAKEAGQLVAYRQLGVLPQGMQVDEKGNKGKTSVLYAADAQSCRDLEPAQFPDVQEALNAWRLQQGQWARIASIAANLDPNVRRSLLDASWALACGETS